MLNGLSAGRYSRAEVELHSVSSAAIYNAILGTVLLRITNDQGSADYSPITACPSLTGQTEIPVARRDPPSAISPSHTRTIGRPIPNTIDLVNGSDLLNKTPS